MRAQRFLILVVVLAAAVFMAGWRWDYPPKPKTAPSVGALVDTVVSSAGSIVGGFTWDLPPYSDNSNGNGH